MIQHITLQSLSSFIGEDKAIRSCAPICFYMMLGGAGYLSNDENPAKFMQRLANSNLHTTNSDWSRPALSMALRKIYGAPIVSWQFGWPSPTNFEAMIKAGYIETDEEITFFKNEVEGKPLSEIVGQGFPVITTMKPGFGTDHNKNIHAIIVTDWKDGKVTVIDPDGRNSKKVFPEERVLNFLEPRGAGSIVLPKS